MPPREPRWHVGDRGWQTPASYLEGPLRSGLRQSWAQAWRGGLHALPEEGHGVANARCDRGHPVANERGGGPRRHTPDLSDGGAAAVQQNDPAAAAHAKRQLRYGDAYPDRSLSQHLKVPRPDPI